MGSSKKWKNIGRGILGVSTFGASELAYGAYKGFKGMAKSADNAYMAQARALQEQTAAIKQAANASNAVQVVNNPTATQQNVDTNAQINAANEDTLRRRRMTMANTYNSNSRLYGSLTGGKSILGG